MTASSSPATEHGPPEHEGERLVLELGQALHRYGTPAHRIELILERLSSKLGFHGQFIAVPTPIIASFGHLGEQRGGLVRLDPAAVDLGKLARPDKGIKALARERRYVGGEPRFVAAEGAMTNTIPAHVGACAVGKEYP